MLLGLLAGVVLDVTGGTQGINAILLTAFGLACGMLVNNMIRNNVVTALIFPRRRCLFIRSSIG